MKYDDHLRELIRNAEKSEYLENNYLRAASLYNDAFSYSVDHSVKGTMLNLGARNLIKAGKFASASEIYVRIIRNFPDVITESGIPVRVASDDDDLKYFLSWSPDSKWIAYSAVSTVKIRPESTIWEADFEEIRKKLTEK